MKKSLSRMEIAALREGDIVYVRMEVRKPLGDFGTVHCRISDPDTWVSYYLPVFPDAIVEKAVEPILVATGIVPGN